MKANQSGQHRVFNLSCRCFIVYRGFRWFAGRTLSSTDDGSHNSFRHFDLDYTISFHGAITAPPYLSLVSRG